jgi:hypothetical protein
MLPPDSPLFSPVHIVEYDYTDVVDAQHFAPPPTEQVHTLPMPVLAASADVLNVPTDVAVIPQTVDSATPEGTGPMNRKDRNKIKAVRVS